MKTTLTVDIEYDPELTDPESLASAMDRLMETMLSTPEIMDEYGNPKVGEFFAAGQHSVAPQTLDVRIDPQLFASQRQLLAKLVELAQQGKTFVPQPGEEDLLDGLLNLTDAIADSLAE